MKITKLKIWKGFLIWQLFDKENMEVTTKMKYYGRNFKVPK